MAAWLTAMKRAPEGTALPYTAYPVTGAPRAPKFTGTISWSYGLYDQVSVGAMYDRASGAEPRPPAGPDSIKAAPGGTVERVVAALAAEARPVKPMGWVKHDRRPREDLEGLSRARWHLYLTDDVALAADYAAYAERLGRGEDCSWLSTGGCGDPAVYWSWERSRPVAVIMPLLNAPRWRDLARDSPGGDGR